MDAYTVEQAHTDGRHAGGSAEDQAYWLQACTYCQLERLLRPSWATV